MSIERAWTYGEDEIMREIRNDANRDDSANMSDTRYWHCIYCHNRIVRAESFFKRLAEGTCQGCKEYQYVWHDLNPSPSCDTEQYAQQQQALETRYEEEQS